MANERISPHDSPSKQIAEELDSNGKWMEAAEHFEGLHNKATDAREEARYSVQVSQMAINVGDLELAETYLNRASEENSEKKDTLLEATIILKRAWIADLRIQPEKEISLLSDVEKITDELPESQQTDELISTTRHFMGRANFLMGVTNNDMSFLYKAMKYFYDDLDYLKSLQVKGDYRPANIGFQHEWIALCYAAIKKYDDAWVHMTHVEHHFKKYTREHRESAIMSHYYLTSGKIALTQNDHTKAREYFEQSLSIRKKYDERNDDAEAEALMGIAKTYEIEDQMDAFRKYKNKAIDISPRITQHPTLY